MSQICFELRTFHVLEPTEVGRGITAQPDTYAGTEEWTEVTTYKGTNQTPSRFMIHLSAEQIEAFGGPSSDDGAQFDVTAHLRTGAIQLVE